MMEQDPEKLNDADRQIQATIFKEGQDYAERNKRSKAENKGRAESRERIKGIGLDTNAYHTALRLVKDKSPRELKQWLADFNLVIKVMGSRQQELFPEEALRAAKREEDRKAREKAAKQKDGSANDTNKRSDPKSGGAGGAKGRGKAKDKPSSVVDLAERRSNQRAQAQAAEPAANIRSPANDASEQQAGEDALNSMTPETQAASSGQQETPPEVPPGSTVN